MTEFFLGGLDAGQVTALALAAFLAGVNKTGMPGVGIVMVPLLAMVIPARASTGLLLPLLALADLFAVAYYRKHADWGLVFKLLPWSLTGIIAGSAVMRYIDDKTLKPAIGFIVLAMLIISWARKIRAAKKGDEADRQLAARGWRFAALMGFLAGFTTQIANAAGPVMIIYLLAMGLGKNEFMGAGAWYFLITNWLKIPLFVWDGRVNWATVRADLSMLPFIALGAWAGIAVLKKMPQGVFNFVMQILALAAALQLCWSVTKLF
jgi:uncharacterized membrane protein YfcA